MIISDSGIFSQTNQSVLKIQRLNKQPHVTGMYSSEFICEKAASNCKPFSPWLSLDSSVSKKTQNNPLALSKINVRP